MGHYLANKAWRLKHSKIRYESKKRYYRKHGAFTAINYRKKWLPEDIADVLEKRYSDPQLEHILGRSVTAIQKIRWQYKGNQKYHVEPRRMIVTDMIGV